MARLCQKERLMNIRKIVISEMEKQKCTPYKMAKDCEEKGICSHTTFYNFYNGDNELGFRKLEGVFSLLQLDIVHVDA